MTEIMIYRADCIQKKRNTIYPHKEIVHSIEELLAVTKYDHVAAEYKNNHRAVEDFIRSNCVPMDCDNSHSDDPSEWKSADDVADYFPDVEFYVVYSRNHMKSKKLDDGSYAEPRPKMHIFFPCTMIDNVNEYYALKKKIESVFPWFDSAATDPARFLNGADCGGNYYPGEKLITDVINDLPDGPALNKPDAENDNGRNGGAKFQRLSEVNEGGSPGRYEYIRGYACSLRSKGKKCSDVRKTVFKENNDVCKPPLDDNEVDHAIDCAFGYDYEGDLFEKGWAEHKKAVSEASPEIMEKYSDTAIETMDNKTIITEAPGVYDIPDPVTREQIKGLMLNRADKLKCKTALSNIFKTIEKASKDTQKTTVTKKSEFFDAAGRLLHNIVGDYLIKEDSVCKINDTLHIYSDGIYKPGFDAISARIVELIPDSTERQRKEVYSYLRVNPKTPTKKLAPPNFIPFRSNIYDLNSCEFIQYDSDYVFLNRFPVDYDPMAPDDMEALEVIKTIADNCDDTFNFLLEEFGYIFYRKNIFRAALAVYNRFGENGKSSLLNIARQLAGDDNVSYLSLQDAAEKFRLIGIYGKTLNVGDDIPANILQDTSTFRKLVTGQTVTGEKKGQDPISFVNYAKLWFAMNTPPPTSDRTQAFFGRLFLLPLQHDFSQDPNRDANIATKTWSQSTLNTLCKYSLNAFVNVLDSGAFTAPQITKDAMKEYKIENDPVLGFMEDDAEIIEGASTTVVYDRYKNYCAEAGFKPMPRRSFTQRICDELKLKSKRAYIETSSGNRLQLWTYQKP